MSDPKADDAKILSKLIDADERERAGMLERLGKVDHALCRRMEELLAAHESAGDFLANKPALEYFNEHGGTDITALQKRWPAEKTGDRIGRYKLIQQIGEGGCGVVYLAEQQEPVKRRVALKVIKLGMDSRQVLARFEAERQALAIMNHPNIAKVYDAGVTETGRPFFVMELVLGTKITDYCDQAMLPINERLRLFIDVCDAVQHAHQKGIIHRDLKPSNLLVTVNDGVAVVKVIDFGIAKATQGRLTDQTIFTAFEQFLGTPAYMSPEQATMNSVDIDTRSDIYSLGVLLYELLTGTTPFEQKELLAEGLDEMRRKILEQEPQRPSTRLLAIAKASLGATAGRQETEAARLVHLVNGDLDWIAMKCLEKERGRRYESASALAQDIKKYIGNEPISARPPSNLYRFQKLIRRNKLAVAAMAAVFCALVFGLGLASWQYREKSRAEAEQTRLRAAAEKAQANEAQLRVVAEQEEFRSRQRAYAADMNLLQKALADDDLARAQELLDRQRPRPGQKDLRGWEWRYFWQFCQSDAAFTLCQRSNSIISVSFSSDGSLMAVGTWQGEVSVWNLATREMIFQHDNGCNCPRRVAFAPQGDLLAYYEREPDTKKNIVIWNSRTRTEVRRLPIHDTVRDIMFTPTGELFAVEQSATNDVTVWDVNTGILKQQYTAPVGHYLTGNAFTPSPDGKYFAEVVPQADFNVEVWERNGKRLALIPGSSNFVSAITFATDGKTMFTAEGYSQSSIVAWDFARGEKLFTIPAHRGWVNAMKILRDGKTMLTASADRTIRVWDLPSRHLLRTLRGNNASLWCADLSSDGRNLVTGSQDGSVTLWNLDSATESRPQFRTLQIKTVGSTTKYSPDGKYFAVASSNCVLLINPGTLVIETNFTAPHALRIQKFDFSPDSRNLAACDSAGDISVWNVASHQLVTNFQAYTNDGSYMMGYLPKAGTLLASDRNFAHEWNTNTWQIKNKWKLMKATEWAVFSAGGELLIVTDNDSGLIDVVNLRAPEKHLRLQSKRNLQFLGISADGKTIDALERSGDVEIWDVASGMLTAVLPSAGLGSYEAMISADGRRIAVTSDADRAVKLWDLDSAEELVSLPAEGSLFGRLSFSPDGNTIAACNQRNTFYFWTAPSWENIRQAEQSAR